MEPAAHIRGRLGKVQFDAVRPVWVRPAAYWHGFCGGPERSSAVRFEVTPWSRHLARFACSWASHLSQTVQNAAQGLSLRTIKDAHVEGISVTEIKDEL
jgi:hypothetical protein